MIKSKTTLSILQVLGFMPGVRMIELSFLFITSLNTGHTSTVLGTQFILIPANKLHLFTTAHKTLP